MSEPEFELYLSLMSKLLRLNAAQKDDIAEELRVHLEDRLAELTAQGKSREEAIRLALDEFGDAGALAWQFTLPHSLRRRRQIMRYSIGSFVALAGIFTLVTLTWPNRPDRPPAVQTVVAQAEPNFVNAGLQALAEANDQTTKERREIEEKLSSREHAFEFAEITLHEALQSLSQQVDLPIVSSLADREVLEGTQVTLQTPKGALSIRSALELMLRQNKDDVQLTYSIKDGVILISASNEDYEVQVYDCRDLLAGVQVHGMMQAGGMMGGAGGGFFSVPAELAGAAVIQFGGGAPAGGFGGGGQPAADAHRAAAATSMAGAALIGVLQSATQPAQWMNNDGQGGSMSEFDGVIVVRHHQAVHRKIEDVLAKLRKVKRGPQVALQPQPEDIESLDIPPGKRLVTVHSNGWQLPVEVKIQPGRHVDLVAVKPDGRTDGVLENLEIAWLDAYQTKIGGSSKPVTLVQQLGFIVEPEQMEQLMFIQSGQAGNWYFMLRGEQEYEEDGEMDADEPRHSSEAEEDDDRDEARDDDESRNQDAEADR